MSNNNTLTLDHIVVQCEGHIASDMDGEKVMLSISKGKYYNLGEVGGTIWEALQAPKSVREVVVIIEATYEISPEIAERDVFKFLEQLLGEALIQFVDPS